MYSGGRTLQVEIWLNPVNDGVVTRYLNEINTIIRADNQTFEAQGMTCKVSEWTEREALAALIGSAIDRERQLQQLKDGRTDEDWLAKLIRDVIKGV